MSELVYSEGISTQEHLNLRKAVGFKAISLRQSENGIKNSWLLLSVRDGANVVGMLRAISDGGYFVYVTEILIHPDYQKQGIGKKLVSTLKERIEKSLLEGENVLVSLLCAEGKEQFYEKLGFVKRPCEGHGPGFHCYVEALKPAEENSWSEDAKFDLEDYLEENGVYLRQ